MSLKIIINQVRKVRIGIIDDQEIPNQAKKDVQVILQLKEIINLISNIITTKKKKYDHYKLKYRVRRQNERNFQANAIEDKCENSENLLTCNT